jgi:hypothetical protein
MLIVIVLGFIILIIGKIPLGSGHSLLKPYGRVYGTYLLLVAAPIISVLLSFTQAALLPANFNYPWLADLIINVFFIFLGVILTYKLQIADLAKVEVTSVQWRKRIMIGIGLIILYWILLVAGCSSGLISIYGGIEGAKDMVKKAEEEAQNYIKGGGKDCLEESLKKIVNPSATWAELTPQVMFYQSCIAQDPAKKFWCDKLPKTKDRQELHKWISDYCAGKPAEKICPAFASAGMDVCQG